MLTREVLGFVAEHAPKVVDLFAQVSEKGPAGRLAQALFRPSPMPAPQGSLDLHPEPATARVLAEISRLPPGIYVCAEPSGCGKTSTFKLAAAKVNGLKRISGQAFPDSSAFDRSLLRHLGVNTAKDDYATVFADALDVYKNIIHERSAVGTEKRYVTFKYGAEGLTKKQRELRQFSFVLTEPTLVIDDAHMLMNDNPKAFSKLVQLLREPAYQRRTLRVILLSSQMDFEQVVRENVSGMSIRLGSFRLPRGSLGDLRAHMLRRLKDKQLRAALPRRDLWLRNAGEPDVDLWLGIAGDSLSSISTFITYMARAKEDAEGCLSSETRVLRASRSALLRALAAAGEDPTVPPGSERIRVPADTPDDQEAEEWQRRGILRRDLDAEDAIAVDGLKLYTWHHPTLRLSAALAFGRKFYPLDTAVPPVLPPVQAVPIAVPDDRNPVSDDVL